MSYCNIFLFCVSILFYAWGEPRPTLMLLASMLINFHVALAVSPQEGFLRKCVLFRKIALFLGIICNICLLGYYKYMNFFIENCGEHIIETFQPYWHIEAMAKVALPLGISFYTFQGLSYIIDAYRGEIKTTRNIITFGCYLTMFPQLVAGPIVRYADIAPALLRRYVTVENFTRGAQRFILGLAKKLLIADTLGRVADAAFALPETELSALAAWAGIICYTLQIYYDFSGYSDMAIGIGAMLGFTFPENFNYPYISRSIREFWRRWHMTLSTWFRDYLYIPLGGNRTGPLRTAFNLFMVFALCGLWHGAQWTFLVWGIYHGIFLVLERQFSRFPSRFPRPIQHIYTLVVVIGGWILFRADNFTHAIGYVKGLLGWYPPGVQTNSVWIQLFSGDVYLALTMGILGAMPLVPLCGVVWRDRLERIHPVCAEIIESGRLIAVLSLLLLCFLPLFGATYTAFIYFRF